MGSNPLESCCSTPPKKPKTKQGEEVMTCERLHRQQDGLFLFRDRFAKLPQL